MMASTWSLALWLTATDHHSTGPDVFTPLSAAGAAESRGAMQSTGPYRDKQRSRMRAPHQRHVPHSSITRSSRVHWLHCFRNCRMDSNRGVDFIVLPAGKSGDGKPDSHNPQAWGLKRGEAALFTVRIDFTCLYLWIWMGTFTSKQTGTVWFNQNVMDGNNTAISKYTLIFSVHTLVKKKCLILLNCN